MKNKNKGNIILIGFMGCGKSTLGKQLALKLSMDFVDMDGEIEKQENESISQIFATKGGAYFRKLETQLLKSYQAKSNLVISTGGGAPCFNNNMKLINSIGKSVYIKLPAEILVNRLKNEKSKRPLIAEMTNESLLVFVQNKLEERESFYGLADVYFDNNESELNDLVSVL